MTPLRHGVIFAWGFELERILGAVAIGVIAMGFGMGVAMAAPGQCTVGDYGTFDCDVATDGGGVTFALPDGRTFAFAAIGPGEGLGYLIEKDAKPGQRPDELGA